MGKIVWKIMGMAAAVLATLVAQQTLQAGWRLATGEKPPTVPEDPETSMAQAVAWAAASGALVGLLRLVFVRKAASFYAKSAGELPAELQREINA